MAPLQKIPEKIHRYLIEEEKAELPGDCLICRNSQFFIGYIEKSNPNCILIYCLCETCFENPESGSIVEKIISYYETTRKDNPELLVHCGEC